MRSDETIKNISDLANGAIDIDLSEDQVSDSDFLKIRPKSLDEFIGQPRLREHLSIVIEAAKARKQVPDHMLFAGPPGLGKTTLAQIIAKELGVNAIVTSGPALERPGDLASILSGLEDGDVLFVDEIHRMPRPVEEVLYPAMEDYVLDIVIGKGPGAQSVRIDLNQFTLVAATTRTGMMTGPLRDRFGFIAKLDYYDVTELASIVKRSAEIFDIKIDGDSAIEIAGRSRGTPRIANRLLKRVRDYAQVKENSNITFKVCDKALTFFEIDHIGLDKVDREILHVLCSVFAGKPVGLSTLAVSLGEAIETIEDMHEPFLLTQGLIERTPRGRVATAKAFDHIGLDFNKLI
jgi:Holliday junction DNA helicase RuvB